MMGMMARGNEIYRFNKEVHIRIDGIKPNKLRGRVISFMENLMHSSSNCLWNWESGREIYEVLVASFFGFHRGNN